MAVEFGIGESTSTSRSIAMQNTWQGEEVWSTKIEKAIVSLVITRPDVSTFMDNCSSTTSFVCLFFEMSFFFYQESFFCGYLGDSPRVHLLSQNT